MLYSRPQLSAAMYPVKLLHWRQSLIIVFLAVIAALFSLHAVAAETPSPDNSTPVAKGEYQGAADAVYPDWFKTSFLELEDDILEAREAGKRLMLVFHQPGCPYCNAFVERNLAQKDIENTVRSNFDVIEINMWGDREVITVDGSEYTEKTFASQLQVQFTPTVLMYEPDGSLALRLNGYYPPKKFRSALDYVTDEDRDNISFNEYLASLNKRNTAASQNKQPVAQYAYISNDDFNTTEPLILPDANNNKPYILLFEQEDCSNCEYLHTEVLSEDDSLALLDKFQVIRVNMWGQDQIRQRDGVASTGRQLAKQLGINYAPTLVLYAADHTEVIRSESWLRTFHTQSILDYVVSNAWQQQPSFQRYLNERSDQIRERGGSVDIFD